MNKIVFGFDQEFSLPAAEYEQLVQRFKDHYEFVQLDANTVPDSVSLEDAVAFIGAPSAELLKKMPNLRWLQLPSAGANHFAHHPNLAKEVTLTNSSGVFGVIGAEHTLALILALIREIPLYVKQTERHLWHEGDRCLQIDGSTFGIIGFGDIGSEIAHRLKAFGARVLAVKRNLSGLSEDADAVYTLDDLDPVLNESDFVVNVLPLTPETKNLFDAKRFAAMKDGVQFINVGRGGTVDERALIDAVHSGKVGGAALDVTAEEPLPENHPLWDLPNILITSHSLGVGPGKYKKRNDLVAKNVTNFITGKPLRNQVNRELGY
ncbi:D-2-hydroxyacid dehydrogenase [Sporolactobacillus terrae]|uniref:D-2-hydroxyacid dehydrogenase n=1 Tax=Sporolactobacillus terrae TaxID=269673 RepID=A0ABX5Q7W9_9BACL|nr:D-2-hydroxyacid dehydrogenase [Sporolactobacillus terrae]QAA22753.1 D-2-hydroxyacid dehydrogenase [Sporolactobacillus terrae]QAA25726.1 D-2-hydroxyacid dehydrogenase [Sporolactobacillus terrae]UAK17606.1 D-2-hydroxyacid dehydrogenase [Sporolactobacillus terrae]